ncbi:MAG: zinc ribbon domain-containing protein [Promethearchaeota archaeon]
MSAIAFTVFDLGAAITGGLFTNIGTTITSALEMLSPELGTIISILVNGFMGLFLILLFPVHWLLAYRPGDAVYALALIVPWILAVFITSIIFSKSAKEGFLTGLWLGGGFMVVGIGMVYGLTALIESQATSIFTGVIDGFYTGLTDLPPFWAIFLSCLEGGVIGGAFGALAGAIRFKPGQAGYQPKKPKKSKKKGKSDAFANSKPYTPTTPAYGTGSSTQQSGTPGMKTCPNCSTQVDEGTAFCTNCGNRI